MVLDLEQHLVYKMESRKTTLTRHECKQVFKLSKYFYIKLSTND